MLRLQPTLSSGQVADLRARGCECDLDLLPDVADFDCPIHGLAAALASLHPSSDERRR